MGYIQPVICVWTNVCYKEQNLDYEEVMESFYEMYILECVIRLIHSHFLGLFSNVHYIVATSHISPFVWVLRNELACSLYSCFSYPPPPVLPQCVCVCVCVCVLGRENLLSFSQAATLSDSVTNDRLPCPPPLFPFHFLSALVED